MGNRGGVLHNADREIVRCYKSRRWITCVLVFRGRHRIVMSPNRYTELFLLYEATALADVHLPCAECRRERYNTFKSAWQSAYGLEEAPCADEMDWKLHLARIEKGNKVTYQGELASLPDGCFVEFNGSAHLVAGRRVLLWTPEGYTKRADRTRQIVTVLTPKPVVECFRAGLRPEMHASAQFE